VAELPKPAAWKSYLVALLTIAAALVARFALDPYLGNLLPYVTFFVAVTVVAWYEGLGPTLVAIMAGACLSDYFFIAPRHSFAISGTANLVGFGTYFMVTVPIALLAQRQKRDAVARMKAEERLSRQEALRESEEQFRILADAIPQLCWMANPDGGIFWYNQRWYGYTGATPEQMEGWGWQSVHDPEMLPRVLEQWKASIATGEPFEMVFPLRGADGVFRPFLTRVMPVKGAQGEVVRWFGTNTDITAQKLAEEALRSSQAKLQGIIDSAMDAIISVNEQQRIVVFNRAAELVFQCKASEAVGSTLDRFIPKSLREVHHEHIQRFGSAGATARSMNSPGILTAVRSNGEEFPIEATISQVQADGEKLYTVILRDITVRKQAEAALEESEERLRLFIEHAPAALAMFDTEMRYLSVSRRWLADYGLDDRNVHGLSHYDVFPGVSDSWRAAHRRGLAGEVLREEADRFVRADGSVQWLRWEVRPWYDTRGKVGGVVIFTVDITERKQAEQALRASEQRWATTLQSIGDAVISTDATGNIDFMNDVAQRLTGWSLPEAKGSELSAIFNIVQEVTRIKPENPVEKVIRLGKVIGLANHTALIRRDGTEIPIEDSGAPIRNREGQIEGVVLVFHDVSEQKKVEKALRSSDRLATTGRLAATIAHEIHNPLDAVGNLLFLIGQGGPEETTRQYVSLASQELGRVTQLTQQMLTFQREAAKPIPVKIGEILDSVVSLYDRKIQSAGIKLEQQVDFDGHILALPGELRQVFANLVGNAIEAVGPRHGTITLRAYASRDWRSDRPGLRIVVADDGPGIPASVRTSIFEPFFTTKGESGTGLGLWITSDILQKYDGTIRLRTSTEAPRSGTCFLIFFPFETRP
jgi:PAS domain S-box-containing protein